MIPIANRQGKSMNKKSKRCLLNTNGRRGSATSGVTTFGVGRSAFDKVIVS